MTELMPDLTYLTNDDSGELHRSVLPATAATHAYERIIPDIEALDFPDAGLCSPVRLAQYARSELNYPYMERRQLARDTGIAELAESRYVLDHSFGSIHLTPLIASVIGMEINALLNAEDLINDDLSLEEYGAMFQTAWFGDILNDAAMTRRGIVEPAISAVLDGGSKKGYFGEAAGYEQNPYDILKDEETGLHSVRLKKEVKVALRAKIRHSDGSGCPVARTSFSMTRKQADYLVENEFIGGKSGYYLSERTLASSGMVLACRPDEYTPIDDVVWSWGRYIQRYAAQLDDDRDLQNPAA